MTTQDILGAGWTPPYFKKQFPFFFEILQKKDGVPPRHLS